MKVRLLGTGAADGIPAMYSESEVSLYARQHGGREIRTRSSALVGDEIKLDFGPDTLAQVQRDGLSVKDWSAIVFTHSHDDHFAPAELQYCLYPFCENEFAEFTIYGNEAVCARLRARYPEWPFDLVRTCSFRPFEHAGYTIVPIRANHMPEEDAQNLILIRNGATFLYATDTGIWEAETWDFLTDFRLDGLVIECTEGLYRTDYHGHMDLKDCVSSVQRLRKMGVLTQDSKVFTTHHSDDGGLTHTRLEELLSEEHISPGWDGCEFDLER